MIQHFDIDITNFDLEELFKYFVSPNYLNIFKVICSQKVFHFVYVILDFACLTNNGIHGYYRGFSLQ